MEPKIKILADKLNFPEGPAVDSLGNIWFVEVKGGNLTCLNTKQELRRYSTKGAPNGIAIDNKDNIWFCDSKNNCISVFNPTSEKIKVVCTEVDGKPLNQPNDLAFDEKGNLLFTCPGNSRQVPDGYICVYSRGEVKKISEHKYFPNGLAFTKDGKKLIFAETYKYRLWKGEWDATTCSLSKESPWLEVGGPIGPDGMAFGEDGKLYVAVFGQSAIKIVSSKAVLDGQISLLGKNPTNCAFLPKGGLLVTETERGELLFVDNQIKGIPLFK